MLPPSPAHLSPGWPGEAIKLPLVLTAPQRWRALFLYWEAGGEGQNPLSLRRQAREGSLDSESRTEVPDDLGWGPPVMPPHIRSPRGVSGPVCRLPLPGSDSGEKVQEGWPELPTSGFPVSRPGSPSRDFC